MFLQLIISKTCNLNSGIFTKKQLLSFSTGSHLARSKLIKICDIYNASRIAIPNPKEIKNEIINIQKDISIKDNILKESKTSVGFQWAI